MKIKCKNCENIFEGNYCNSCGQSSKVDRLRVVVLLSDFSKSLNLESQIFRTTTGLFSKPGVLIKSYLAGRRKKYFHPVKLLLLYISVYVFLFTLMEDQSSEAGLMNHPLWILGSVFIYVPTLSFFSYLISRNVYNYAENLVLNSYALGIISLINLILGLLRRSMTLLEISTKYYFIILFIVPVLYLTFIYSKVIYRNFILMFIYSLVSYLFSLMIFLLSLILLSDFSLKDFAPN